MIATLLVLGVVALKVDLWVQGTFYGHQQGQDAQGACSFSENYANAMNQSWADGAAITLALNRDHFDDSRGCGMCIMYRGTQPQTSHQRIKLHYSPVLSAHLCIKMWIKMCIKMWTP